MSLRPVRHCDHCGTAIPEGGSHRYMRLSAVLVGEPDGVTQEVPSMDLCSQHCLFSVLRQRVDQLALGRLARADVPIDPITGHPVEPTSAGRPGFVTGRLG